MYISRWMDKKTMVHKYTQWSLTQPLKEYIWISSNEVDETGAYYTVWSKSERKTPIQYINAYIWNLYNQMFKLVLQKAEEPEIKLPTSAGPSKKQESSRKTAIAALLTTPKPLTVWITINCGKFFKRWEYQTTWPASWETSWVYRSGSNT